MNDPADATAPARALCVFGGTFDPVHYGHLRAAWEASVALQAEVRMVPCRQPPHRAAPWATPQQRMAMLRLALAGQTRLHADARELQRPGPSYMVDTLTELRAEVGSQRPLILLLGADAFAGLPTWHRWQELLELAHIAVLTRPGHEPQTPTELQAAVAERRTLAAEQLQHAPAGRVLSLAVTPLEISASRVRELIRSGQDARYLTSESVLQLILRDGLYRDATPA